ncbi:hypothetical protein AJ80_10083, partial [Polytolypa hystricis UAMH7299]
MAMEDAIRPSAYREEQVLTTSARTWSFYESKALSEHSLPSDSILLRRILGKVPAYLGHGRRETPVSFTLRRRRLRNSTLSELFVSGCSQWDTSGEICKLPPRLLHHQLLLGVQRSTRCTLKKDSSFASWPGVRDLQDSCANGNYLAILMLAWAYILSALWVEIQHPPVDSSQEEEGCLRFLNRRARWVGEGSGRGLECIEVDLGDARGDAARWWEAVLAPEEGWTATVHRAGQTYRSPWSVHTDFAEIFTLRNHPMCRNAYDVEAKPPSSSDALRFLSEFCSAHNLHHQALAALSAALYLPFHNGGAAALPRPRPYVRSNFSSHSLSPQSTATSPTSQITIDEEKDALPYYMTISCSVWGIRSLLCSTFFNPDISCNLVSPWLEPAFDIIDPILQRGDHLLLAKMMAIKQARLGPLWLGAFLTGAAESTLRAIKSGQFAVELNASAWTSTAQSFLTVTPSNQHDDSAIRRSDECRLLFLTGSEEHSR